MNYLLIYSDETGVQYYTGNIDGIVSYIIDRVLNSNFTIISLNELKEIKGEDFKTLLKPVFSEWELNAKQKADTIKDQLIVEATAQAAIKTENTKTIIERDLASIKARLNLEDAGGLGGEREE
jgi:hypothetical protein